MVTNQMDFLLRFCESHLESMRVWSVFDWWFFNILMAIALVCSILVPFGLAIMLYIPKDAHRKLNIALLIMSGVAFTLQILNTSLHFSDRAKLSRQTYADVLLAVSDYKDGHISREQFRRTIEKVAVGITNAE